MAKSKLIAIIIIIGMMYIFPSNMMAGDIEIVDFIAQNNPTVLMLIKNNKGGLLSSIKVEGKGSAYMGVVGSNTDKVSAGLVVTLPIIDRLESKKNEEKIINAIEQVTSQASQILKELRYKQAERARLLDVLEAEKVYEKWLEKRVEVGVEFMKTLVEKRIEIAKLSGDINKIIASIESYKTILLSLVSTKAREKLIYMLEDVNTKDK